MRLLNLSRFVPKCASEEVYRKDFHNAKQKMVTPYDKQICCRNGNWVIIIAPWRHARKLPDPGLKSTTLAELLRKMTTQRQTDWFLGPANEDNMPQWKNNIWKGKDLVLPARGGYQSTQFPLAVPCNDTHTHTDRTRAGNTWSIDGTCCMTTNLPDHPQWNLLCFTLSLSNFNISVGAGDSVSGRAHKSILERLISKSSFSKSLFSVNHLWNSHLNWR